MSRARRCGAGTCVRVVGPVAAARSPDTTAARWLWRHRIGARGATATWIVLAGIATMWILGDVTFLVGQGNYVRPLEDPLLWAHVAGLVGSIAGVVLLAAVEVRRRVAGPAQLPHG
jgi:hypothetical protein